MQILSFSLLIIYLLSIYAFGWRVMKLWGLGFPALLSAVGAFLIGTGVCVPVTYLLSCFFAKTSDPIFWGTVGSIVCITLPVFWKKKILHSKIKKLSFSDVAIAVISLTFSSWMMSKTFHGDAGGLLFIGSNNVFDFGHALGILRSFSWGSNIPLTSPFESGAPFFYHYYFLFFAAMWEHFGVPIVWALNLPSMVSFAALLIVVYYVPQIVAKQKPLAGLIAVALTITNSSLTFWQLVIKKGLSPAFFRDIWRLPTYPFAGPFDGSTISLFVTLNNYVNQRHLAFSVALGLLLYLFVVRALEIKKTITARMIIVAAITGLLLFWNMAICGLVAVVVSLAILFHKAYRIAAWYISISILVGLICILPVVPFLASAADLLRDNIVLTADIGRPANWNIVSYLWQNLGLLPFIALTGYMLLLKKAKRFLLPFSILFIMECAIVGIGHKGFDQKFLSFLIIPINMLAAVELVWLWERKPLILKSIAVLLFFILTISGIVDLMPIKNEFAFPIVSNQILPIISWIHANTPKDSVFASYADIIDPVVLAGRKNYFGFFGNIGWKYRTESVRRIYDGDITFARLEHIDYIVIPRWKKNDFTYRVEIKTLLSIAPVVYQDADFFVLKVI